MPGRNDFLMIVSPWRRNQIVSNAQGLFNESAILRQGIGVPSPITHQLIVTSHLPVGFYPISLDLNLLVPIYFHVSAPSSTVSFAKAHVNFQAVGSMERKAI